MSRQSPTISIEEHGGDHHPDLTDVQLDAVRPLAHTIAATLRELLAAGVLTTKDGRIIVNPSKETNTNP